MRLWDMERFTEMALGLGPGLLDPKFVPGAAGAGCKSKAVRGCSRLG